MGLTIKSDTKGRDMIPLHYEASVKLPYYGWFSEECVSKSDARRWIAQMVRGARREGGMFKPRYANYMIRPRVIAQWNDD